MSKRLYRARSIIDDFQGLPRAEVRWIPLRAERLRSGPLETLVKDVASFSDRELSLVRGFLDEWMTLPEANALKQTIGQKFGYAVELETADLPLDCRKANGEVVEPLRTRDDSQWSGQKTLPHRGQLKLPFDVLSLWRDANLSESREESI